MKTSFTESDVVSAMNPEGTYSGKKDIDVSICSGEKRKLSWVRETRTRLFMRMKLLACIDELDWMIKCQPCAVNNYPRKYWSSMPLPIPRD